jgi:hypothetical protein
MEDIPEMKKLLYNHFNEENKKLLYLYIEKIKNIEIKQLSKEEQEKEMIKMAIEILKKYITN